MQVTNHSNNKRNMKEELLEAIYGTVERLEQKVDELSASQKYAGAETVPASNDTTKLEKSIIEPTLKSKACLKCLYFTKIISALCCYLEYFSYLYTIN